MSVIYDDIKQGKRADMTEFGAAVLPQCAEAELLSLIDLIDSRMEIYREVLGATPLGGFSDRVFALDGKKLYHHE